ncbi:MAG TPA: glycoside hydrolase family 88 protein [Asticcacaulis sp.]|nr:glycoside hydrolase family 88 protein [Asticcacaulis sp.]
MSKSQLKSTCAGLFLALVCCGQAAAQVQAPALYTQTGAQAGFVDGWTAPKFDPNTLAPREDILNAVRHEAMSEVKRLTAIDANPSAPRVGGAISPNWVSGTFLIGASRVPDAPDVQAYVAATTKKFNYALEGGGSPVNLINADDQTIGDVYETLYERDPQPGILMPLKDRLDFNLQYLAKTPKPKKLVWWWCDSLFMAPPVYARMAALSGDRKYLDAMDAQYWRAYDLLWDTQEHLFARDERFLTRRDDAGKKIVWSRGEGWVIAGLARVLEVMPANYPSRPKYVAVYKQMVDQLVSLQQPDGLWRTSLLHIEAFPEPETSGTALDTYAIAFGINHGLLDRAKYLPVVTKAWAGMNAFILPNGLMGQVQTGGDQPVPTRLGTTGLYASGGYLLAGTEMAKLHDPVSPLPMPLNVAAPSPMGVDTMPVRAQPTGPLTPAQEAENRRRNLERQAMNDLAYDPVTDDPDYKSPITGKPMSNLQK